MSTAVINISASGTILSAPATGRKRFVDGLHFIVGAAVTVRIDVGGVAASGAMSFAANGGMSTDDAGFELAAGEVLALTLGSSQSVQGWVKYRDVEAGQGA
jgi:hypothetical protein